jgi:hypothetical protein
MTTKGEKDGKRVIAIRALTNFRIFESDYTSQI